MATRWWVPLLVVLLAGCGGASRVVRLDTHEGERIVFTPRIGEADPVELAEGDFAQAVSKLARDVRPTTRPQEAAQRLFEVEARSGSYQYEPRSRRIQPLEPGKAVTLEPPEEAEVELTRAYLRWCERTGRPGDCLRLLVDSPTVTGDGRYALAMALAQGAVLEEMMQAFAGMADPRAMLTAVLWTWTTYMVLLTVPEPFSKGLAAVMTATLVAYVGIGTFWSLLVGFQRLVEESDRATTFDELRAAGERYGRVMGREAARAFAMLALAAIGNTAAGLAAKVPSLPGAAQAAVQAETQVGIRLVAVADVTTVALSAQGVTLSLASTAVAATARSMAGGGSAADGPSGYRAWKSFSGFKNAMGPAGEGKQWHHIVEQTPGNAKRFGPEALHNTKNIIPLDTAVHTRVSALYSSIRRDITGSPMTVRQWLSTQPYEAQRKFGLQAIENIRKGLW
jgi:hypothetical protein